MPDSLNDLERKSARAVKWQSLVELFMRLAQFVVTIVLARLLMPKDFGMISVALIFAQLAFAVFDIGFSAAIIQKKDVEERHLSTAFFVNLVSAILFTLLVFFISPFIARYFGHIQIKSILRLMTLIFFFYTFSAVPRVTLMRSLRFKRLSSLQAMAVIVYSITAVGLALTGFGVWSIVFATLAEQLVLTLLLNLFSFWRISLRFQWQAFRELAGYGGPVLGTRLSAYGNNNIPNFIIGKWLGAVTLGYFTIAYQLAEFPVQRIFKSILKAMFPALSRLQNDNAAYSAMFLKLVYFISLIVVPLFSGLCMIAPNFISFFYGSRWLPAIIPVQVLSMVGLLRSYWVLNSLIFLSKGKPAIELKINILYAMVAIPVLYLASPYGLNRITMLILGLLVIFYVLGLIASLRLAQIPVRLFLSQLRVAVLSTVAFVALYLFVLRPLWVGLPVFVQIGLTVAVSAGLYLVLVYVQDRNLIKNIKQFAGA